MVLIFPRLSLLIDLLTFLLGELMQKATFPYAHITDDDIFENVGIVIRSRRHVVH